MTPPVLRAAGRVLPLARPLLMGIVNATPDSFSDAGELPSTEARVARGRGAARGRARTSSTSAASPRAATARRSPAEEEIERVVPLIARLAGELGALVSVDTYKPAVAEAAIARGRRDGQRRLGPARSRARGRCARDRRGARAHAHARGAEGHAARPGRYDDVVADVDGVPARADGRRARRAGWRRSRSCSTRARTSPRRPPRRWPSCARLDVCSRSGGRCCWRSRARTSSARSPAAARASAAPARWPRSPTGVDAGAHVAARPRRRGGGRLPRRPGGAARRARARPGRGAHARPYPRAR